MFSLDIYFLTRLLTSSFLYSIGLRAAVNTKPVILGASPSIIAIFAL